MTEPDRTAFPKWKGRFAVALR
ncbi:protein of unknown function [Azospirillum baldaniorum]|uniref:Uncharacterized protein n=1 Tax=Azospirillum baldaniorum TaxID=1064539 RepID=A0A9P1NJY9_9PROT|nr:protein of unknown function [Azospirillum baldaniorum]